MLLAQRLIAEHKIDENQLAADIEAEEAVDVDVEVLGKRDRFYEALACIVANNFRCKVYFTQFRVGKLVTKLHFIGMESDAAAAKLVYEMAKTSMLSNRAAYIKQRKQIHVLDSRVVRDIRVQWTNSFCNGMAQAFRAQVVENEWAMVLQLPALVVQKAKERGIEEAVRHFGKQYVMAHDTDAQSNGRAAGEAFAKVSRSGNQGPANAPKMLGA